MPTTEVADVPFGEPVAGMVPLPQDHPTVTVPQAGVMLGISRGSAYAAARRGEIPTICIGGRMVVPTAELRRMLRLDVA